MEPGLRQGQNELRNIPDPDVVPFDNEDGDIGMDAAQPTLSNALLDRKRLLGDGRQHDQNAKQGVRDTDGIANLLKGMCQIEWNRYISHRS